MKRILWCNYFARIVDRLVPSSQGNGLLQVARQPCEPFDSLINSYSELFLAGTFIVSCRLRFNGIYESIRHLNGSDHVIFRWIAVRNKHCHLCHLSCAVATNDFRYSQGNSNQNDSSPISDLCGTGYCACNKKKKTYLTEKDHRADRRNKNDNYEIADNPMTNEGASDWREKMTNPA